MAVVFFLLPLVNVLVVPGWKFWVDPAGKSAVVTSPKGNQSGFWSTNDTAPGLGLADLDMMLQRHDRARYKPRSPRHARACAAGVTRIGTTARPKNGSKPFGWWEVARDEYPLPAQARWCTRGPTAAGCLPPTMPVC
ncbi:hypothetical protein ABDK96_16015 [Citricoccus nitrophenolicus]|uniref:Uncharacterized protein n=1 Tax=Citricoccus nitrophenolicus TaxID=863575 RepID=A0ABV0IMH8_9MICC